MWVCQFTSKVRPKMLSQDYNTTFCIDAIEIQKTLTYKCTSSIHDS